MKTVHTFEFNEQDNGGETLSLTTTIIKEPWEDSPEITQELSLQSYKNSATFTLCGALLTPEVLRQLADELEEELERFGNREEEQVD